MHVSGDGDQKLANPIKKDKRQHETDETTRSPAHNSETSLLPGDRFMQLAQAPGADYPVIVLCNAFAAKELPAFRAAGSRFARDVMKAVLFVEGLHHGWERD